MAQLECLQCHLCSTETYPKEELNIQEKKFYTHSFYIRYLEQVEVIDQVPSSSWLCALMACPAFQGSYMPEILHAGGSFAPPPRRPLLQRAIPMFGPGRQENPPSKSTIGIRGDQGIDCNRSEGSKRPQ